MQRRNPVDGPITYTTFQVARFLGVSPPTVVNWVTDGLLAAHRTPGGHRRILRADLVQFASARGFPLAPELEAASNEATAPVVAAAAVMNRILIVDDEIDFCELVRMHLGFRGGWETDIASDQLPPGLSEDVVRAISAKKGEPEWLLAWRLKAYAAWQSMTEPTWQKPHYPPIDYQKVVYYSAPKKAGEGPQSLEDVDPKLLATYEKLGIPPA